MRRLLALQAMVLAVSAGCRASASDPPLATSHSAGAIDPASAWIAPTGSSSSSAAPPGSPAPDRELDESPSRPAEATRLRMQAHFEGLREIERMILGGDLDGARERATAITFDRADAELPAFAPYIARMRQAAGELSRAESLQDACRAETRVASECASCHLASGAMPTFIVPEMPPDGPTRAARMARHQWAADRLWEGLIGLSDQAWRDGTSVLAATPLPAAALSDDADRMRRLAGHARELQRAARLAGGAETPASRGAAYGELLAVCATCHANLDSEW